MIILIVIVALLLFHYWIILKLSLYLLPSHLLCHLLFLPLFFLFIPPLLSLPLCPSICLPPPLPNDNKRHCPFKKTLLTFIILIMFLLNFRDYVEICNSSVDGFTQHVSYFCCTIDWYLRFRYWCLIQIYYYYY